MLTTALAVTSVLLLIITSAYFIRYLADAAAGEISIGVVFELVVNRIPRFLELLLPLGLFLGILISHGRLYLESEMVVLQACGTSQRRLIAYTFGPGLLIAILVGFVSIYLAPAGMYEAKRIIAEQRERTEFDLIIPGAFQSSSSGQVTYARDINEQGHLIDLFVSGQDRRGQPFVISANSGEQRFVEGQGRYLVLQEGMRYQGTAGETEFEELSFDSYGIRLPDPQLSTTISDLDAIPTSELISSTDMRQISSLHWRLSLPILALVVVLLAVPLAKTSPRRGQYAKLIPSILVYQLYVAALSGARSSAEQGDVGPWAIWGVHLSVALLALSFTRFDRFWAAILSQLPHFKKLKPRETN